MLLENQPVLMVLPWLDFDYIPDFFLIGRNLQSKSTSMKEAMT
jgi:hypothetical protein